MIHIIQRAVIDGDLHESDVDESLLDRKDGQLENDNEITKWVEYRFKGTNVVVHRSVHVTLKKWPEGMGAVAGKLT